MTGTETGHVRYSGEGRGGTIHFKSEETSFDMWYELAMPPALIIIGIPEPRHWEARTRIPLSRRTDLLRFIGAQIVKDKLAGDGYVLINDSIMEICKGRNPRIA